MLLPSAAHPDDTLMQKGLSVQQHACATRDECETKYSTDATVAMQIGSNASVVDVGVNAAR